MVVEYTAPLCKNVLIVNSAFQLHSQQMYCGYCELIGRVKPEGLRIEVILDKEVVHRKKGGNQSRYIFCYLQ